MFMRDNKSVKVRGEKTDIWALGITFFFLLSGSYPCGDAKNAMQLKDLILNREIDFEMIKNLKARKLLQKILVKDPEKRATLEEIQQDEWLVKEGEDI